MPVYTFRLPARFASTPVTVYNTADVVQTSGTTDSNANFVASLPVGDYYAKISYGYTSYRAAGEVDRGDLDNVSEAALAARPEAGYDATTAPDGTVATFDTGQSVVNFGNSPLSVSGGKITKASQVGSNSGGYIEVPLSGPVVESYVDFSFPSATAGTVVIAWPEAEWANAGLTAVDFTLVVGLHLVISRTGWIIQSYDGPSAGANNVTYAQGSYGSPLALNTVYRVTAALDRASSTLHVLLPDGTAKAVTHSLLTSKTSNYAVFELYELTAAGNPPAAIHRLHASSKPSAARPLDLARMVEQIPAPRSLPLVKLYNPATPETTTNTTGGTGYTIPNITLSYTVPVSGAFRVDWAGHITMSAASTVYWSIQVGGQTQANNVAVVEGVNYSGPCRASFLVTGQTPGASVTVAIRMLTVLGATASYQVGGTGATARPTLVSAAEVLAG